jgi:hypothetical protein
MGAAEKRELIRQYWGYTGTDQDRSHEFRGDRVARETIYVAGPFEAPASRARRLAAP